MKGAENFQIRSARIEDVPSILRFIRELAVFEKLEHEVRATEATLRSTLFCEKPAAEVLIGETVASTGDRRPVAFALFFHNYSTFLACPGIYLEDLYVIPEARSRGFGRQLLAHLARLAIERGCGRFEWSVLDWNEGAIRFYRSIGAEPMSDWTVQRVTAAALEKLAKEVCD